MKEAPRSLAPPSCQMPVNLGAQLLSAQFSGKERDEKRGYWIDRSVYAFSIHAKA